MSFRNRLTLFFILLVVVPVMAVAAVGIVIVRDSEEARNDATIARAQLAARGLYRDATERAATVARTVGTDDELAVAVRDDDRAAQQRRLDGLARRTGAVRVRLTLEGEEPVEAGSGTEPVAPSRSRIVDADGRQAGAMDVSVTSADDYADVLASVTGNDVLLTSQGETVAGTLEGGGGRDVPLSGEVDVGGDSYRVTGFTRPGFGSGTLAVRVLIPEDELQDALSDNTAGIFLILIAFVACALVFAIVAARSLGKQTTRLLEAARKIGRGDLTVTVPTEGRDEFAALAQEFNSMARQLEARQEELRDERRRVHQTVEHVGKSIGQGLDRDAMLKVVVDTAVEGVGAAGARVMLNRNGELSEAARAGDVSSYLATLEAGEAAALGAREPAETTIAGVHVLARPLSAHDSHSGMVGVISMARPGRPFTEGQQELLAYLTNQAAISIENVDLHETVQRQAVTDELTGLFNHRRFQEVVLGEVHRARRFGHELGLVMLDIDDFKRVNDTYGHLQGDQVLREVAHVLRDSSREIDEPARYGGEEMAVALPQTGLEGAYEFAERVRRRIEALQLSLPEGEGTLRVTASFGVASLPPSGEEEPQSAEEEKDALVAAADAALYRAKRSGKNRTVKAEKRTVKAE